MKDFCEAERERIHKWANFQLPNRYKQIGLWASVVILILMVGKKFVDAPDWVKPALSNALIISFLVMSLSREKIEDELIRSLRSLSYRWAFVTGVIYAVLQPYISYGVDLVLGKDQPELDSGYFPVLIFMLFVQLASFYQLKRLS